MPISATGNKRTRGFTLVELLVVLVIIGVAGAAVLLTVPVGRSETELESRRFAAQLRRASEEAILSGRPIGLDIDGETSRFATYAEQVWAPITDGPLAPGTFAAPVTVYADGAVLKPVERKSGSSDGEENDNLTLEAPQFLFEETGEAPILEFQLAGRDAGWVVRTDGVGGAEASRARR